MTVKQSKHGHYDTTLKEPVEPALWAIDSYAADGPFGATWSSVRVLGKKTVPCSRMATTEREPQRVRAYLDDGTTLEWRTPRETKQLSLLGVSVATEFTAPKPAKSTKARSRKKPRREDA